jgi:hypothetical protein
MKISELIAYADMVKPNGFDSAVKLMWINDVEGTVMANVLLETAEVMANYRYVMSATWTGTGVTFPTTETMLLTSACGMHIGGTVTISGLTTNAVNNKTSAITITDISEDHLTLTFADDTFTVGLTADVGTAVITFDGTETELIITTFHSKLYRSYLVAMIDYANGEYDKYNNTMQMYNRELNEFTEWYTRIYRPADPEEDEED